MTINVTVVGDDAVAAADWERYVARHADASTYHRLAWREIFRSGMGYRSWLLLARESSGAVCGALPLYLVPAPFQRRLVAVPFRDRGGPLWDTPPALDALLAGAQRALVEARATTLLLKTVRPLPEPVVSHNGLRRRDHWLHSSTALTGMSEDGLWQRIGPKTRNMVRQAEHHGLACRTVTTEAGAVERWHRLHVATQKRLGVPPFPRRFFDAMLHELRGSGGIEILEVAREDTPCAATILLLHADTCIYGYSASTDVGQRQRANDLMLFTAIKLALTRGLACFDLGSDSPSQESLLFFKRKWGAAQAPIPLYSSGPAEALSDSSDPRYSLARAIVRHTPAMLLTAIGGRMTRYFG